MREKNALAMLVLVSVAFVHCEEDLVETIALRTNLAELMRENGIRQADLQTLLDSKTIHSRGARISLKKFTMTHRKAAIAAIANTVKSELLKNNEMSQHLSVSLSVEYLSYETAAVIYDKAKLQRDAVNWFKWYFSSFELVVDFDYGNEYATNGGSKAEHLIIFGKGKIYWERRFIFWDDQLVIDIELALRSITMDVQEMQAKLGKPQDPRGFVSQLKWNDKIQRLDKKQKFYWDADGNPHDEL